MSYLPIMFGVALAVSAVGWIYFIYFFSIGYGLSITALSVAIALLFAEHLSLPVALLLGLFALYGVRLAGYLLHRERRSASYKKILYQPDNTQRRPLFVMLMIWLSCALLYVGQMGPAAFYLHNASQGAAVGELWAWIGMALAALGIIIEIVADAEKSAAKRVNASRFVDKGLYRIVRCPNYFGEVLMWTGSFVVCFGACCTLWQWVIAIVGYVGIVYVMFSGARRLEMRQAETYGADPEFQAYIKRTPLILPFLPLYSVAKHKWLKA